MTDALTHDPYALSEPTDDEPSPGTLQRAAKTAGWVGVTALTATGAALLGMAVAVAFAIGTVVAGALALVLVVVCAVVVAAVAMVAAAGLVLGSAVGMVVAAGSATVSGLLGLSSLVARTSARLSSRGARQATAEG